MLSTPAVPASTQMPSRQPFELVRLQELERFFHQPPTEQDYENITAITSIPRQHRVHEVVFAAPECRLTTEYIEWMNMQPRTKDHLDVRTMPVQDYIKKHGPDAIPTFYASMMAWGHPHQPVRVVRDARRPKPADFKDCVTEENHDGIY